MSKPCADFHSFTFITALSFCFTHIGDFVSKQIRYTGTLCIISPVYTGNSHKSDGSLPLQLQLSLAFTVGNLPGCRALPLLKKLFSHYNSRSTKGGVSPECRINYCATKLHKIYNK